jgi:hypothetical protein
VKPGSKPRATPPGPMRWLIIVGGTILGLTAWWLVARPDLDTANAVDPAAKMRPSARLSGPGARPSSVTARPGPAELPAQTPPWRDEPGHERAALPPGTVPVSEVDPPPPDPSTPLPPPPVAPPNPAQHRPPTHTPEALHER